MKAVEELWRLAQGDPEAFEHLTVSGDERQLPSVYRVSDLATASVGASTLAAAECFRHRTGRQQDVHVYTRRTAIAFRSERYLGIGIDKPPERRDSLMGFYETGDGRWIQLHTDFKHHRDGVVKLLGCSNDHAGVTQAIRGRNDAMPGRGVRRCQPVRRADPYAGGMGALAASSGDRGNTVAGDRQTRRCTVGADW